MVHDGTSECSFEAMTVRLNLFAETNKLPRGNEIDGNVRICVAT